MNNAVERMTKMFIGVDACDWEMVKDCMAETVHVDYSSMTGQSGGDVKTVDLIEGWKSLLPGFDATHHQLGNVVSKIDGNKAYIFSYVNASHHLDNEDGKVWTVVGSYDIDMKVIEGNWKITSLKLNFKYQDGNVNLPQLATEAVAKKV